MVKVVVAARKYSSLKHRALITLAAAAAAAITGGSSHAKPVERFVPGRIIVMPRAGMPEVALKQLLNGHGAGTAKRIGRSGLHVVDLPVGREREVATRLARHPHIKFAEVDAVVPLAAASNDPYLGSQWHLNKINAPIAWDDSQGAGITIAILDTGVDGTHPDLAPHMVPGWNLYDNNANTADVYGHGTKVAGSAAAAANNSLGVAGVAGKAMIMPLRVSDAQGYASWSTVAKAITWAADRGARVANISYVVANSAAVISAANYMKSKGGVVVTSAGNYGTESFITPTDAMLTVSATDTADNKASWSSFGNFVSIAAPGSGIYTTTKGGGYAAVSGTSYASPITAGVIGLMMAANPSLAASDVQQLLFDSAVDLGTPGRDAYYGHGRIDAAAAVQAAMAKMSTVDTEAPAVAITNPVASSTVGGLINVDVAATDNVGVTRVELRANGALVATDTTAPFAFSWDTSGTANGPISLVATAWDSAGNPQTSATVPVYVANAFVADTTAPTVSILNPVDGQRVSGSVTIKVASSDDGDPAALSERLYINGKLVFSATGAALQYRWNTRKIPAGRYEIRAVATDAAGNSTSRTVIVTR